MRINSLGEEQDFGGLMTAEDSYQEDMKYLLECTKAQTTLLDDFIDDRESDRSTKFSYLMLRENHRICKTLAERISNYRSEMAAQNDK